MSAPVRYAMLLGFVVTLLVALVYSLGGFDHWERLSVDWRFTHVPRQHAPMSSEIVHVDIDDGALRSVGWWPWPRSKVAMAINELHRAGVRTIASDVLFTEPQDPTWLPGLEEPIDHDGLLAEAFARVPTVFGVAVSDEEFSPIWQSEQGRRELRALLDVLERDIRLDERGVLNEASLTGGRRARFLAEPRRFRERAAWNILDRMLQEQGEDLTFEAFVQRSAPTIGERVRDYPERRMLEDLWDKQQAWRHFSRFLLPGGGPGSPLALVQISRLAASASGVGFVNRREDDDGVKRSVPPLAQAHRGRAYQLGVAAAIKHLGVNRHEVVDGYNHFVFRDRVFPLREGALWLNWPTAPPDAPHDLRWASVLRQSPHDPEGAGHLSIGVLVSLAEQRKVLEGNRRDIAVVTQMLLAEMGLQVELDEAAEQANLDRAAQEVQFTIIDDEEIDCDADNFGLPPDTPESHLDHYHNCCLWLELRDSIEGGEQQLEQQSQQVRAIVEDKLAFIGWTATGALADFVPTPLGPNTPGVIVHAVVADMMLTGRAIHFAPVWTNHLLILLVGIACTLAAAGLTPFRSALVAAMLLGTYAFVSGYYLFVYHDHLYTLISPLIAGGGSWIACTTLAATLYQRDRLRITRQFRARVSAQLVDYLVEHPDALSVGGQEREVTILFADLAGFTRITERMGGKITVTTINRYMNALTDQLVELDAYVNKFLGDGLMAFWSAFSVNPNQAAQACRASLRCIEAVEKLNDDPEFADMPRLGLRVGVATGKVVVGDCGAPPALNDYTVIGDAVNLSSRLEGANKAFGSRILIDERTHEQLVQGDGLAGFRTRPLGRVIVVGQSVPVGVYEVLSPDTPDELLEMTREAVEAFSKADAAACRDAWRRYEERFGEFPLAQLHNEALLEADEDFDGVLHLRAK